jgi:hypothetical protein
MDRSQEIALLTESLELVRRKQLPMAGDEARVPVSDYLNADRFEVDQTRIEIMTVAPKPGPGGFSERASSFLAANHAFTKKTLDEDWKIAEQIQSGMQTGANEFFRFAKFEGALTQWHRRLNEKLAGYPT